jgi:hypothetical protein
LIFQYGWELAGRDRLLDKSGFCGKGELIAAEQPIQAFRGHANNGLSAKRLIRRFVAPQCWQKGAEQARRSVNEKLRLSHSLLDAGETPTAFCFGRHQSSFDVL